MGLPSWRDSGEKASHQRDDRSKIVIVASVSGSCALVLKSIEPIAREAASVAARSNQQTESDELPALGEDEAEDIALLRAERHADAEFAGALHHIVSHDAVDTDRRDDEGDERKDGEQRHCETLAGDAVRHDFFERANGADGLVLVHAIHGGADGAEHGGRRTVRANDHVNGTERNLRERLVRLGAADLVDAILLDVAHDATISRQVSGPLVMLIRLPIGPRSRNAGGPWSHDDRDPRRLRVILRSKDAAAKQADAHRPEVIRSHRVIICARQIAWIDGRPALDVEAEHVIADERHRMRKSRGLHAGNRFHPVKKCVGKSGLLFRHCVFFLRKREPKQGGVLRDETRIDARELYETARQQTRSAKQHQRESHFDHDERTAQPAARAALGGTACALLERFVHIGAGREPRRSNAEHEPGDHTEREREEEHSGVETNFGDPWQAGGSKREESNESPAREKQAGRASAKGEDDAFGEKLADKPGPARAQRRADGNFAMARGARARRRFARFAQAMSRTQPTAPSNV